VALEALHDGDRADHAGHAEPVVADLRVCVVGDSFYAGVGDPYHLGWVGRVAARTQHLGLPLTAYSPRGAPPDQSGGHGSVAAGVCPPHAARL